MIVGDKINLVALDDECLERTLEWSNKPELKKLIGTIFPISRTEHLKWFDNRINDKWNKTFGIQLKEEKKIVGIIGNKNFDTINRNTELFLYIGDECMRGKGIGTEAINEMVKFCFNQLNLHKVMLKVFSYNHNAIRTYEKCGFNVEGILKENLFRDGKYHDVICMAIIN